ncbi:polysaccharide deacetylase [Xanthomonas bromi]|uniref:Polysaccharide deacetylase n=1 Tax=Xanthomonas bromi TaxID=56449 RepID=A0A1C3NK54_9XANT|nr:polysaccharide deacetylase [Xanthomonas bromi]
MGQQLFHEHLEQRERIAASFDTVLASREASRFATIAAVLDAVESTPDLYDADRLAFREVLRDLHPRIGRDSALPAVNLHQRIGEDLEALDEIERSCNTELTQIFSRFDRSRAIVPKREKWDDYVARAPSAVADATVTTGYAKSWVIVIDIDVYAHWHKLEYAANDAQAIASILTGPLGFPSSQVIVQKNGEATRNYSLATFHDRLGEGRAQTSDRVFVFFAGHGATRRLASGRDLGYIIPVDSDPEHLASDAIAMSDLQNIAESLQAKHVLFVMDACYSGLGVTRGGPTSSAYLRENARRITRQVLNYRWRRSTGGRQRAERAVGVHLGAVAGADRQVRSQWRWLDHRHRAGRVCGACGVGADTGVRQPAGVARWRIRLYRSPAAKNFSLPIPHSCRPMRLRSTGGWMPRGLPQPRPVQRRRSRL